ncbi:MAG: tRNA pseudouridine(38-40) synthase TruA [Candidatus Margulisbacteria bacterium]|jgi:tRNA pseudouridine38-40 synthase|nr:tRNA pseudouridine(38-40) synthase TruA [Candidatus Margulisiibacteriota bacterium]
MPRHNLFLRVEYLGTAYAGSQIQPNGITIQELLDKALSRLFAEKIKTVFSGRTDSGVHALAQAVSALVPGQMPADRVRAALNALLPPDIRVSAAAYQPLDFNPRYAARSREYLYNIYCGARAPLYLQRWVWPVSRPLDFGLMRKAARLFKGTHDFAAFCAAGSAARSKVRRVTVSELQRRRVALWPGAGQTAEGVLLTYRIRADGFLYHQVRNMAAALVAVGLRKMTLRDLQEVLRSRKRSNLKAPTAPAAGLVLSAVSYC